MALVSSTPSGSAERPQFCCGASQKMRLANEMSQSPPKSGAASSNCSLAGKQPDIGGLANVDDAKDDDALVGDMKEDHVREPAQ